MRQTWTGKRKERKKALTRRPMRKSKKTRLDLVEAVETGCDGQAAPVPGPRRGSLRAKEKTSHLPSRGAGPAVSRAEHIIFSLKSWEQRRTETRKLPQKTLLEWF